MQAPTKDLGILKRQLKLGNYLIAHLVRAKETIYFKKL
jgi:hypothetical protein